MGKNFALTVFTIALAGLCCLVELITVRAAAPTLLASHAISLTAGVAMLALAMAMGQDRLAQAGLIMALCVAGLCLCCYIEDPDCGFNRKLVVFGRQLLEPAFFIPPSLVMLFAWTRRNHRGTTFFASAAIAAFVLAVFMPSLSEATLVLVLGAALYGLAVRVKRHRTIQCLAAAVIAMSPFVLREIYRSWLRPDPPVGFYVNFSLHGFSRCMVSRAEWFGSSADCLPLPHPIHLADNTIGYASYYCGNWSIALLAVALPLLSTCLAIAALRARTATQRILAVGGATALTMQIALGVLHLFFLVPRHSRLLPFVSANGSYTIACFMLLGIVLATLRTNSGRTEAPEHGKGNP